MANNPPTVQVIKYKGTGNVEVYPLLPTQVLGSQTGADVGTGTANVPTLVTPPAGQFVSNAIVEFLDDQYCIYNTYDQTPGMQIFKKDQGGADQWGQVYEVTGGREHGSTGLLVLHIAGVPTLAMLVIRGPSTEQLRVVSSTNGTSWTDINAESSGANPNTVGQAIIYRNSIFWAHQTFSGGAGTGFLTSYDFALSTLTRYDHGNLSSGTGAVGACGFAMHVHAQKFFMCGKGGGGNHSFRLFRLDAGSLVELYDSGLSGTLLTPNNEHPTMFTDPTSGDLIVFAVGQNLSSTRRTQVLQFTNPETGSSATPTDISGSVLGATEGANKYAFGGASATINRRWNVYVDNDTVPTSPRIFLWTWTPGGLTECWEWKGVSAELEAVSSLAGISDDFSLPSQPRGGGIRSPGGAARVELGDTANPPEEVVGGTKFFFRVYGSGGPSVMTLYYNADEEAPDAIATLTGAVTVESGSPATTPSRSGNTITNLTADDGATLYSFIHDATSDSLGEGATYTLMPDIV